MQYLKKILIFSFISFVCNVQGQNIIGPNLVQNPSFEDHYQCPFIFTQLPFSKYWWGYSTEYFNSCCTNASCGVPFNSAGYQNARTGVAYAACAVYSSTGLPQPNNVTGGESIKNLLNDNLIKHKRYCINYYISLSHHTVNYAGFTNNNLILYDSIGAMFSVNQVQDNPDIIICDSCAKFAKSVVGIDTVNWHRVSATIIAKGNEQYLTIGKFNNINWPANFYCQFYVYVDDVSVCECNFDINLGEDTSLCNEETMLLNATLPNATYLWQDGSTNATYEAKQPETYWVRAYIADYDITTTDTITITAKDETICNPLLIIPNFITPNGDGNNDYFKIGNAEKFELDLKIFNRWGNLIYRNTSYKNDFNCKECADGVYYYLINAKSLRNGKEKAYKGSVTVMH